MPGARSRADPGGVEGEADPGFGQGPAAALAAEVWAELERLEPGVPWVRGSGGRDRAFASVLRHRCRHRVFLRTSERISSRDLFRLAEAAVAGVGGAAPGERHTWLLVGDPVDGGADLRAQIERFNREHWSGREGDAPRVRLALVQRAWGVVTAPGGLDGLPSLARMRLPDAWSRKAA